MKNQTESSVPYKYFELFVCSVFMTTCGVEHTTIAYSQSDSGMESGDGDYSNKVGSIHVDEENGPLPEPGIECDLPDLLCGGDEIYCGELIQFNPKEGQGYIDYPENGESASKQERSFYRRDLVFMIKYAAAYVACKAARWDFGNGGPIGVIDGSTENGENPGGYWEGTHIAGLDLTMAYFQVNTADNRARAVCEHMQNGQDMARCVGEPDLLDPWRTALFLGTLFLHPSLRVAGCDGKVGPALSHAMEKLCENGWLSDEGCRRSKLAWEETDAGAGWYYSHHHHMQISMDPP